ncbi:MAG: hypothetical protein LBL04_03740 [Bacteroidales bacterium]|jgi:hypothetical protein|nr:hypothetical protein [Bacteroidales bacterium]
MAKNRKKKQTSKIPHSNPKAGLSKSQFDYGCTVAQKTMSLLKIDPAFFSMFSKKQKHAMLNFETHPPVFRAMEGNRVPRKYISKIRETIMEYMRTGYIDEEIQLTYMDFVTYGISFICSFQLEYKRGIFTAEQKEAFAGEMMDAVTKFNTLNEQLFENLYSNIWFELGFYSQMNFRTYGFEFHADVFKSKEVAGLNTVRYVVELTSYENDSIYFTHNDVSRKAYRVIASGIRSTYPPAVIIRHCELYSGSESRKEYSIYIQSHVIHRFKERIDNVDPLLRNYAINLSMAATREIVKGPKGHTFMACSMGDFLIGYFPYTVYGDKVFLLSFLPLVSQLVPEGEKLYNILNLGKDELVYLGMDKLSFFATVDFDEIPILKNALIESGIWAIKMEMDETPVYEKAKIDTVKTQFVKNFFEKTEMRRIQSLSEDEWYNNTGDEINVAENEMPETGILNSSE